MANMEIANNKRRLCSLIYNLFFKIAAFYCFILAILSWVRILGFYNEAFWRIDLMPTAMQIFAIAFAVLYPLAYCGLWHDTRWGKLLWGILMLLEGAFFLLIDEHFAYTKVIIITNFCFIIFYLIQKITCINR